MLALAFILLGQAAAPAAIDPNAEAEVTAVLEGEQAALLARDCGKVVSYWTSELTMVVEGRRRASSKDELRKLCGEIMALIEAGRIPPELRITHRTIDILSPDIAYEVSEREGPTGGRSSVSKVLVRTDDGWKITHLHEAIARPSKLPPKAE